MIENMRGKRGVSLVEEVCAAAILMIVVVGLLSLIGASHTSVLTYNAKDQAYAKAEEVGDRVMAALAQESDADDGTNDSTTYSDDTAPDDVLNDSNVICKTYDYVSINKHQPPYSKKPYYFYLKVTNPGIDESYSQVTGYNIRVLQYYSKTKYVEYDSYVCCSGKDV